MKSNHLLSALFAAAFLAGCGGGGSDPATEMEPAAAPAAAETPAPTPSVETPATPAPATGGARVTSFANCPANARRFTSANSVIPGGMFTVGNASAKLSFTAPSTTLNTQVCVAEKIDDTFPVAPPPLAAMLTVAPTALVFADGEFDRLSNKQITWSQSFRGVTEAQIAAKQVVSYTQGANGVWVRTALPTTRGQSVATATAGEVSVQFTAPVTAPGFFGVE